MPFDPDQFIEGDHYPAKIKLASITESEKGTVGLYLKADTDRGEIDGTLWITPNTRDRVIKTIDDLGLDPAILGDSAFWDDPAPIMVGVECSIVPEINSYEGTDTWRVRWWNGRRKTASPTARSSAKNLFAPASSFAPAPSYTSGPMDGSTKDRVPF